MQGFLRKHHKVGTNSPAGGSAPRKGAGARRHGGTAGALRRLAERACAHADGARRFAPVRPEAAGAADPLRVPRPPAAVAEARAARPSICPPGALPQGLPHEYLTDENYHPGLPLT